MGHYDSCYEYDEEVKRRAVLEAKAELARKRKEDTEARNKLLDKLIDVGVCMNLEKNFETVAALKMFGAARYAKGFSDGTLLREFCEDYVPEPYFPMGDSRPTAERLAWSLSNSTPNLTQ